MSTVTHQAPGPVKDAHDLTGEITADWPHWLQENGLTWAEFDAMTSLAVVTEASCAKILKAARP